MKPLRNQRLFIHKPAQRKYAPKVVYWRRASRQSNFTYPIVYGHLKEVTYLFD